MMNRQFPTALNRRKIVKRVELYYRTLTCKFRVLPNFIIIGATRSGTTSLYQDLILHPNIIPAFRKEPSFFNHNFDKGVDRYKLQFPSALHKFYSERLLRKKFATGEATANYFYYPSVPEKIFRVIPEIKLILLLRNPVDRAYSDYHLSVRSRKETRTFEKAIEDELHDSVKLTSENEREILLLRYLLKGIYVDSMKNWFRFFRREQILILKSEDFYREPSVSFRQVIEHLELPHWEPTEYADFKEPGRRSYGSKYEGGSYSKMSNETRRLLVDFYRPHNQRLYDYLQVDFGWEM